MDPVLYTQFLEACKDGDLEGVRHSLSGGANPNWQDVIDGYTGLHFAIGSGQEPSVRALLDRGADIEHNQNVGNITPLGTAVLSGHIGIVQLLLDEGADPTARIYSDDRSISDVAEEEGSAEIASLLRRAANKK
ncbi:MAG: ankyrin repeat domain-containing protein [Planctomycetota bacterium]